MGASAGLNELPAIAGRIAEARIHRAVAGDRFLGEFDAAFVHHVKGFLAILDHQNQRRHRAFGHGFVQILRRRLVNGRSLWPKQAQLEILLVRCCTVNQR